MAASHAPLPWTLDEATGEILLDAAGELVVDCGARPTTPRDRACANAKVIHQAISAHPLLIDTLTAVVHTLRSYQHGNASQDLAKEVAGRCELVLAQVDGSDVAGSAEAQAEPSVEDRVMAIVIYVLSAEPERPSSEAHLVHDLGADSLDLVEIEVALEEAFGLAFTGHDSGRLSRCSTIADVGRLVSKMVERRSRTGEAA